MKIPQIYSKKVNIFKFNSKRFNKKFLRYVFKLWKTVTKIDHVLFIYLFFSNDNIATTQGKFLIIDWLSYELVI